MMKAIRLNLIASTALTAALINLSSISSAKAAPQGGVVVGGTASISTSGAATNINQSTNRAAINWQSFNVDVGESVNFTVPNNGATLNRVIGNAASTINGTVTSNGSLYLVNPNGLVFDTTSKVTAQNFIAATGDINPNKFMEGGNITTERSVENSRIDLRGNITAADRGVIGIFAPKITNSGKITANLGQVTLGGVQITTLNFSGDNLMSFEVSPTLAATVGAFSVENHGAVVANGGNVTLSAEGASDLLNAVIINDGTIDVGSTKGNAGTVNIKAVNGYINETGIINALGSTTATDGTVTISSTGRTKNYSLLSGTINAKDVTVNLGSSLTVKNLTTVGLANKLDITASGIEVYGTNLFSGDANLVSTGYVDIKSEDSEDFKDFKDKSVLSNAGISVTSKSSTTAKGSLSLIQQSDISLFRAVGININNANLSAGKDLTITQNGAMTGVVTTIGIYIDTFRKGSTSSLYAGNTLSITQNGTLRVSGSGSMSFGIFIVDYTNAPVLISAGGDIRITQNGAYLNDESRYNGISIFSRDNHDTLKSGRDIYLTQINQPGNHNYSGMGTGELSAKRDIIITQNWTETFFWVGKKLSKAEMVPRLVSTAKAGRNLILNDPSINLGEINSTINLNANDLKIGSGVGSINITNSGSPPVTPITGNNAKSIDVNFTPMTPVTPGKNITPPIPPASTFVVVSKSETPVNPPPTPTKTVTPPAPTNTPPVVVTPPPVVVTPPPVVVTPPPVVVTPPPVVETKQPPVVVTPPPVVVTPPPVVVTPPPAAILPPPVVVVSPPPITVKPIAQPAPVTPAPVTPVAGPVVTSKDFRISYSGSTDVITNYSSYVPQTISVTGLTPVAASDVKVTATTSFDSNSGLYKTVVTLVTPGNANRNSLSIQKVDFSANAAGGGVSTPQIQLNVSLPSSGIQVSTANFGGE